MQKEMGHSEDKIVTRFEYQKLLGYQIDSEGKWSTKVYVGNAVFLDGSTRIVYGILKKGDDWVDWNYSPDQTPPTIDIDNVGIRVKKEK